MFDVTKINHADIPAFLKQKGGLGIGGYQKLVDYGHDPNVLQQVIQGSGIEIGPGLRATMSRPISPAGSGYTAPTIQNLSAYDLNKVQQSLNQYQATQGSYKDAPGYDSNKRNFRTNFERAGAEARAQEKTFKEVVATVLKMSTASWFLRDLNLLQ